MAEPEPEGSAVLDAADFLLLGLIPSGVNAAETGSTTSVATPNNNDEAVNNPPLPLRDDASAPLGGSESLHNVQHADSRHEMPGTKKRGRPKGSEGQQTKNRKRTGFIDLTGVPPQPLILKSHGRHPTKAGSSKFMGAYYHAPRSKWKTQIVVEGKKRHIGYYDNEEDAAADYARAAYKYTEKKSHPNVYGGLDLSGAPVSLPLIRNEKSATGFSGVTKNKQRFQASMFIRGEYKYLGTFATPEEAALVYARAKWYFESMPQINAHMGPPSVAAPNNEKANDTPLPLQQDASAPLGGSELVHYADHADSSHVEPGKRKKRGRPKGSEGQQTKNRKRTGFIDLTGVPPQPLILKNHRRHPAKAGSSKFMGAYYNKKTLQWRAQIMVEGKKRHIGYYDNEEDAAADFARAAYKYKKKKNPNTGFIDLTGVPPQPLILKDQRCHPTKAGSSKFMGAYYDKKKLQWKAQIVVEGKDRFIGSYDNEEDAAADYARAAYKYKKKKNSNGSSNVYGGLDLSGVPVSLPLIRSAKATTSTGFAGVTKNKQRFQARIFIQEKKIRNLGTFDTPEEAARIYARAKYYIESIPQGKKKESKGMPSGSAEGPAAVSSDTGFIAEISDTRGANSGGNYGKNADDDPVGDVLDEDPVDTSYMSDVDYSEVDGVAV